MSNCIGKNNEYLRNKERCFFSSYRLSKTKRVVIRIIPFISITIAVLFPLLSLMLYIATVNSATHQGGPPPEMIEKLRFVISSMAFFGVLMSVIMFTAFRIMACHIYQMEIICTDKEIIQHFPNKEIRIFWSEIKKVRKIALGRIQQWSIVDNNGNKIKADATFIEMKEPLPELKTTWRGDVLQYADESTQELTLKENELYSIIRGKANCLDDIQDLVIS